MRSLMSLNVMMYPLERERLTVWMALTLTMAPRWTLQNRAGSSSLASSEIAVLIRNSPSLVLTDVYLSVALK